MSDFANAIGERLFNRSLALIIPTNVSNEEFNYLLNQSIAIDKAKRQLVKSDISFEDYLDAVEFFGVDIDTYIIQVEQNLINNLNAIR
ncbi:MAG: hypothetical protein HC836_40345 [Richelia sp. RM2_1_2]|nr:hypothetical protein [Richelia sp. SM1_7_0]NJN09239.1 hypothetical protein [Richelia sp. RM1_1_1]NJO27379.1 hypothetical protein [Richelia sp. SL_2_1]NJO64204.1 hypothetical protein [Richelia sp. RM2_1_2]